MDSSIKYYPINFINKRNVTPASIHVIGRVIIHESAIFLIIDLSIYVLSFHFIFFINSLNKPTPKIHQIAICVELTGSPN